MKVALVYDRVNKWGGAERVLLALHRIFPDAPLFTSVYNPDTAKWAEVFQVHTSFLQKIPKSRTNHEFLAPLMPLAFESLNLEDFDLVISVTSEAAKGVITKPGTLHICYCLTPTRYLWSGYETYFKNPILRLLGWPFVSYLRKWDLVAANRPDKYIAISKEVQKRIEKYYGANSEVIFPPLSISDTKPILPVELGYFLIVSRLVPYKKIDMAIDVFNKLGYPLIIIGTGRLESGLKRKAKENIKFLKNIDEGTLYGYYSNCKALIFPGKEDFGLSMAEAQFFGKPVIAYGEGGALDIVKEKVTGELFKTRQELVSILENFNPSRYNKEACIENSEKFTFENFKKSLLDLIDRKDL
jgi:glycosyltransferase involved in cell wall biosynthesis